MPKLHICLKILSDDFLHEPPSDTDLTEPLKDLFKEGFKTSFSSNKKNLARLRKNLKTKAIKHLIR